MSSSDKPDEAVCGGATANQNEAPDSTSVQSDGSAPPPPPPAIKVNNKPEKKKPLMKGFKLPFFGSHRNKHQPEPEPDPQPPEGAFRRRTSSVGPNEDVNVQKKKSGNLGKYRKDIEAEPRSTPNF